MSKGASSILSLGIVIVLIYIFLPQLKTLVASMARVPSGTPTPGNIAGAGQPTAGTPWNITSGGLNVGEVVPGLGFIPQSALDKNPNSPSGGLGITGYD